MENSTTDTSQIQHAAAADPLTSPILKLDVDCFEELFEWLSLVDLCALRQTCKRLKQVVDYFIKNNYPAVKIGFGCIMLFKKSNYNQFKELDPIKVKMINEADVINHHMNVENIDTIRGILPQLERLSFYGARFKANFYESILKWCSNLKYLAIDEHIFNKENPEENDWLKHQLASTIEHLQIEYHHSYPAQIELVTFLQSNPNIQTFSINSEILESFSYHFLGSNIKIDQLNVCIFDYEDADEICRRLDRLYKQDFYKRLHLAVDFVGDQAVMDRIAVTRGMEKLTFDGVESDIAITLPPMPFLQEICFNKHTQLEDVDINSMARNLINLERVYFAECQTDFIIPFIRYARKMREIKVDNLKEGAHFENGVIDLSALNKERKGLAGASNVTIYVEENIFLSTKFATTKTNFNLITLKRAEAVDWTHEWTVYDPKEWSY